ncbi:MAG: peptidoglycan-binding protein [Clostridia bacterium]|nr:peptidoglycan-binding protein [Clostridia bacterium]
MYNLYDKAGAISDVQRFLLLLSQNNANLPHLSVDGIFNEETVTAVKEFQRQNSLPITGKVEKETFDLLYLLYTEALKEYYTDYDTLDSTVFPLKIGDSGSDVAVLNTYIRELAKYYLDLESVWGDFFSTATEKSVSDLQGYFREKQTGTVTKKFFARLKNEVNERQKF